MSWKLSGLSVGWGLFRASAAQTDITFLCGDYLRKLLSLPPASGHLHLPAGASEPLQVTTRAISKPSPRISRQTYGSPSATTVAKSYRRHFDPRPLDGTLPFILTLRAKSSQQRSSALKAPP